ncbi:MAG: ECF-type sigma factor [Planctomycetota bacterium]
MANIDDILARLEAGDSAATDELFPLVYDELRSIARHRMASEPAAHTLDATALVNEAYLRLTDSEKSISWSSRAHFFGAAAQAMRRILIDRARRYQAQKRSGNRVEVSLDALTRPSESSADGILRFEAALRRFEDEDPQASQIVSLRYFSGLSVDDTAQALGLSTATVKRGWAFARAWLQREIDRLCEND